MSDRFKFILFNTHKKTRQEKEQLIDNILNSEDWGVVSISYHRSAKKPGNIFGYALNLIKLIGKKQNDYDQQIYEFMIRWSFTISMYIEILMYKVGDIPVESVFHAIYSKALTWSKMIHFPAEHEVVPWQTLNRTMDSYVMWIIKTPEIDKGYAFERTLRHDWPKLKKETLFAHLLWLLKQNEINYFRDIFFAIVSSNLTNPNIIDFIKLHL